MQTYNNYKVKIISHDDKCFHSIFLFISKRMLFYCMNFKIKKNITKNSLFFKSFIKIIQLQIYWKWSNFILFLVWFTGNNHINNFINPIFALVPYISTKKSYMKGRLGSLIYRLGNKNTSNTYYPSVLWTKRKLNTKQWMNSLSGSGHVYSDLFWMRQKAIRSSLTHAWPFSFT